VQLANRAGSDHLVHLAEVGVETAVEADLQLDARFGHCFQRGVDLGQVVVNRFFAEDVLTRRGGLDDDAGVGVGRGANGDRVDGRVVEDSVVVGERGGDVQVGGELLRGWQVEVGDGSDFSARDACSQAGGVDLADAPGADDSETERFGWIHAGFSFDL